MAQPVQEVVSHLYDYLKQGDHDTLLRHFQGEPLINTPLGGEVKGRADFIAFTREQQAWLQAHQASDTEVINMILSPERMVAEVVVYMVNEAGEDIDLPIAVVADLVGSRVAALRVYHSTWPLTGRHIVRAPILEPASKKLDEPAVIEVYMKGIADPPDLETVLGLFTDDAYVREPSGQRYGHEGASGRREFYGPALESGGISLIHCAATWAGTSFAVEFICDEWAHVKLAPQAGMAVYETTEDGQKLTSARIYDDVMPPFE